MKKKYKIETIIIGFGKIAYGYNQHNKQDVLTHYKSLYKSKNFKLTAFVEPNNEKRKKIVKELKIKGYANLSQLKDKVFPRLAIICSPTNSHIKVIRELIKEHKSVKTILCEKPFGSNYYQAKKVTNELKKKKIKLFINYMRISDPGVTRVKKLINKNFKKQIKGIVFYDGSTLNQASHLINLLQYWLGKVISIKKIQSNKKSLSLGGVNFTLKFKGAEIIFIGLNISNFSYASIELISPSGRIEYSQRGERITYQKAILDKTFGEDYLPDLKKTIIYNDINNYQANVLKELYLNFTNKKSYLCTGDKAVETLKVISKLY